MDITLIDGLGFLAALITNLSIYPQVYRLYIIVKKKDYAKLNAISITAYSFHVFGCCLYLIYSSIKGLYPIIFGSILFIIPALSIIFIVAFFRDNKKIIENKNSDLISDINEPQNIEMVILN